MGDKILATQQGIKVVGVGRKGSRPLTGDLLQAIQSELRQGIVPEVVKGAFLAGLVMKGPTDQERVLDACFEVPILDTPSNLLRIIGGETPQSIQLLCGKLLARQELSSKEAKALGGFLFSSQPGDAIRGLVASLLRVRYETAEEYEGLLQSMEASFVSSFTESVPVGKPVVAFAEPFDGVTRSHMLTPLLMRDVQQQENRVVAMVGRNSGPKFGTNLQTIAQQLNAAFLNGNVMLTDDPQPYGWYVSQEHLSPAVDRWVQLRRQIIKRPFLATLERFVNPCAAQVMVASAFHPPYGEKMLTICERAGFPAAIIIRNGMEGGLAFAPMRQTHILCSVRNEEGVYQHREIVFKPSTHMKTPCQKEARLEAPDLGENVRLIREFAARGQTENVRFDDRVKVTCAGLTEALKWVKSQLTSEEGVS